MGSPTVAKEFAQKAKKPNGIKQPAARQPDRPAAPAVEPVRRGTAQTERRWAGLTATLPTALAKGADRLCGSSGARTGRLSQHAAERAAEGHLARD